MIGAVVAAFIVLAAIGAAVALFDVLRRKSRWAVMADSELMRDVCRITGESGEKSPGQVAREAAAYRNVFFAAQVLAGLGILVPGVRLVSSWLGGQTVDSAVISVGFVVVAAMLLGVFVQTSAMFGIAARRLRVFAERGGD